jgi:glutamine cyclotransferase
MSSGMNGDSHIDILNIETMEIERTASLESQYFGEGVTKMNDYYYMLTYTSRVLFKFD